MNTKPLKERISNFIANRWIYCVSLIFTFIMPAVIIGFKAFSIKAAQMSPTVSMSIGGVFVGLIYIAFVAKKLKAKIEAMEQGATKIFLKGTQGIIPFAVAAFLFEVIEKALEGAAMIAWAVIVSLFIGVIIQIADWEVNKEYLYSLEIEKLAKKQADINIRIKQLEQEAQQAQEEAI